MGTLTCCLCIYDSLFFILLKAAQTQFMPRFGDVVLGTAFGDSNAYSTFVCRQDLNDIIGVLLGLLQIEEHV